MHEVPSTPLAMLLHYARARAPRALRGALRQASLDASVVERRLLLGRAPSPLVSRPARRPSVPAPAPVPVAVPVELDLVPVAAKHRVTILDGATRHVCTPDTDQYVLAAALESGIEMPFSCALGGCGACKVQLVEGSYVVDEPCCLTDEERAAGFVLTCVGRATSACTLEIKR